MSGIVDGGKIMKRTLIGLALMTFMSLGISSCSLVTENPVTASPKPDQPWSQLQKGMSYSQVNRALTPMDPGLKEDIETALNHERHARKEQELALAKLRANGVDVSPDLPSTITIDRGDYVLEFENGKLVLWERK